MSTHPFLKAGTWQSLGTITFTMAEDQLPFTATWQITPQDNTIRILQIVTVTSLQEGMRNTLTLSDFTDTTFTISLENELVTKVMGKGVLNDKLLAWEYRAPSAGFEGYEILTLQPNGTYTLRGEFSGGEYRTQILGTLKLS